MARARGWLRGRLDRARQAQELGVVHTFGGEDAGHRRLSGGEGAGLVQHDAPDLAEGLERLPRTHQDPLLRGTTAAADHGERRGHAERAGVAHHRHGEHGEQAPRRVGVPNGGQGDNRPQDQGSEAGHQHRGHEPGQDGVVELDDAGLEGPGLLHVAGHLGEERVLAHLGDLDHQRAPPG